MIDNYSLKARIYPVLITLFPILLLGGLFSIQFSNYSYLTSSVAFMGAASYFMSHIGRENGKKKENKLWQEWGGAPSMQILRFSNTHLDRFTKLRYHKVLEEICPLNQNICPDLERADPALADEVYAAWNKFLLSQTRDNTKFNLLYKDNIFYGFRRNLWGFKFFSVMYLSLLISITLGYNIYLFHFQITEWPIETFGVLASLVLILLFWIFYITKSFVKLAAFAYAERLLETAEIIANSSVKA
jgi:hypothetical protein